MTDIAFITGINGQDGSYLSEFLLKKGYKVYGIIRRNSLINTKRIDHLMSNPNFKTFYGDVTDLSNLIVVLTQILKKHESPNRFEIYNLAAQSHVKVSFEEPIYTAHVDAIGTLNILEAVRILGDSDERFKKTVRFYQASTSELYGKVQEIPQKETTPFYPRSPYGVAKIYSYWIVKNYREAYNLHASNGVLFNHESERRGETFVTRKITIGISKILKGIEDSITLGNLDSKRDWCHAEDMVRGMWMMLQQESPDDYVLGSGECHTVREFVEKAFAEVGKTIVWEGKGVNEVGKDQETGKILVRVSEKYFRPTEVDILVSDPQKANEVLGWKPDVSFEELIKRMINHDISVN